MNLIEIAPSSIEPVTFEEAKDFLKIEDTESNDLIISLIKAATKQAENYCECSFLSKQWSVFYDQSELETVLELPMPNILNINNVFYYLEDDTQTVYGAVNYRIDKNSRPGRFSLREGKIYPSPLRDVNSFEIQYTAGYGTLRTDVPDEIRQAVKLIVAGLFENRESGNVGIPEIAKTLLAPYRVFSL